LFGFAMGDAKAGVAGVEQFAVAPAVALEGDVGRMEVAAVGLDDELGVGPEEVDLDAALGDLDRRVEARRREAAPKDEWQHLCLQRALELALLRHGRGLPPFVN